MRIIFKICFSAFVYVGGVKVKACHIPGAPEVANSDVVVTSICLPTVVCLALPYSGFFDFVTDISGREFALAAVHFGNGVFIVDCDGGRKKLAVALSRFAGETYLKLLYVVGIDAAGRGVVIRDGLHLQGVYGVSLCEFFRVYEFAHDLSALVVFQDARACNNRGAL